MEETLPSITWLLKSTVCIALTLVLTLTFDGQSEIRYYVTEHEKAHKDSSIEKKCLSRDLRLLFDILSIALPAEICSQSNRDKVRSIRQPEIQTRVNSQINLTHDFCCLWVKKLKTTAYNLRPSSKCRLTVN